MNDASLAKAPVHDTPVHVIGASGKSGQALIRRLLADGIAVVPVVRSPDWQPPAAHGDDPRLAPVRRADLGDAAAMAAALADASRIVNTAHARHTASLLAAAPASARLVLLGSTRRFTRFPDTLAHEIAAGETAFLASRRPGVMLHPTMIYGASGEENVQRLAAMLRRLPFLPLPNGGRSLLQPIHQDDVTRSIRAALAIPLTGPESLVIAGAEAVTYADFARAVAAAAGLSRPRIVSVPAGPLMLAAWLTTRLPTRLPLSLRASPAEIRRLLEDKAFPVESMAARLGIRPLGLAEGLARTFPAVKMAL